MTDTDTTETTAPDGTDAEVIPDGEGTGDPTAGPFDDLSWPAVRRNLQLAAIAGLALLAAWATLRIYASAGRAIAIWISPDFVPIFEAVFNAIVVVVAVAAILRLRRSLS